MSRNLAAGGIGARSADLVRRAAHAALLSFEKTPVAADLLVERFSAQDFDARDRAFLRELIYGVLRWRGRLDFVFGHFLEKPNVAPPVREALRLGTYQLLFMDRVPPHSAVDGSVSLLGRRNLIWAKGLVNAVLRKVAECEVSPPEGGEDYLTIWESHPRWLVKRWMRDLGDEEAHRRCRANNGEAPVVFRVNTRASNARSLMAELASEGVATRPGCADPDCLVFLADESAPGARFGDTAAWRGGRFIVMDESSSLVSRFAGVAPGESVLDACAAPGGKTACLAWAAGDNGRVVAGEKSPRRLARMKRNCVRIRTDVRLLRMDAERPPFHRQFDLVLVDAPCSGLGVFRRHPDARWRLREEDLKTQAHRQVEILRGAARTVRPGGRLVYSVCTNEAEETEEVAASFREPGFVPVRGGGALPEGAKRHLQPDGSLRITPGDGLDGFFAVSWRKEGGNC
ncbi:MAG: 16S rRNA (cytosine(967)-C(5))-methyltransferase RsmB [Nitrospinae bacterium]|nr:16S rRNA (cytosine(967)-C(5))-methyltransferase RsmB [Nitrospinota bacterium]